MSQITINANNDNGNGDVHSQDSSWANARAGSQLNVDVVGTNQSYAYLAGTYFINRSFMVFSLSGIPSGSTISSVTLNLYGDLVSNVDSDTLFICQGTQSLSSLTTSDWSNVVFTSLGSIALSSLSTGTYNSITLNSTGISLVQNTIGSNLKLAVIMGRDFNNNPPSGNANEFDFDSGRNANVQQLVVTYTPPGAFLNNFI